MGVKDLLPHLVGGDPKLIHHSFEQLNLAGEDVVLDAASALWQFGSHHPSDHLRGNHNPALVEWTRFLVYLRDICRMKLKVVFDGARNADKQPEIDRRQQKVEAAAARNDLRGQVTNTPDYIAKAAHVCEFLNINYCVAPYEADPQVAYMAKKHSAVTMTCDSDLLAYGVSGKLVVVKGFKNHTFRLNDLNATVSHDEYPLSSFYNKHGRILFQLYAACRGCDFTTCPSGISGIGYETFIKLVEDIDDLNPNSLAIALWENESNSVGVKSFDSSSALEEFLQRIVDIYEKGHVYDQDANVIEMRSDRVIKRATQQTKAHMGGKCDSRSMDDFEDSLRKLINDMDCSQLIHRTLAEVSEIRGVNLPKNPDQCTVPDLRDFCAARGGKISLLKADLITNAKLYQFIEQQVSKAYVDRNPNKSGSLYENIYTGSKSSIKEILTKLSESPSTTIGLDLATFMDQRLLKILQ